MALELSSEDLSVAEANASTALPCLVFVARQHGLHLTVPQLVHENVLPAGETSSEDLIRCAANAGLSAKSVTLEWDGLQQLKKALPAIVRLRNGSCMVLVRIDQQDDGLRAVLQDPNASAGTLLVIDQFRLAEAWTGEVILIKRNYEITNEAQPFSIGLISALLFRERRIVRDIAICALVLGLLALSPIIFWRLLSRVIEYRAFSTLYVLSVGLAVCIVFETAFHYIRQTLVRFLTARLDVKLSTYVFDKVLHLPIEFFEKTPVGLIARDVREIYRIRQFLMGQLLGTVLDSSAMLFFLPVMFLFSPLMTFIVLGFIALIVVWLLIVLPYYRDKSKDVLVAEGDLGAFLVQSLAGMRTIKSLALDARQMHTWDVLVARTAKARLGESRVAHLAEAVVRPLEQLTVSVPFAVGAYVAMSSDDPIYIGTLFAFVMLSRRVVHPLMQMAQLINQYDDARSAVAIVGRLVNQLPEEGRSGNGVRTPIHGDVSFSNVTFKYKGTVNPALEAVSFELATGKTLGVMGKSGSGKTTITRLMQRLHSDYDGLIKVDGIDVREYDVDHLRRSIGVVLQENFLFSGTIRENIAIAKPDASFEEVVRAARLAGAEEFIDRLPRGYETQIYEGSPNLSGGQRQRLAIARALIVDPPILILDEATSALDADSEAIVNANIARIAHGRTLIIISHRLSALMRADAILVLDQGCVNDIGKHEELLRRNDIYSGLWQQQNGHLIGSGGKEKSTYRSPTLVS